MKKLNLALIGYGKMGKTIESLAEAKSHKIVLRTDSKSTLEQNRQLLKNVDVAIEFTSPDAVVRNLEILAEHGVNTVCGSTGWLDQYERVSRLFREAETGFLYASNFSIGVNIFFSLNRYLAKMMSKLEGYDIGMMEAHHIEKKDAPSGTAVSLAEQIIEHNPRLSHWHLKAKAPSSDNKSIEIEAIREADIKGTHQVSYQSPVDSIQIRHEAYSREGFASGSILAAEFLHGKKGIYSMTDVLGL